MILMNVMKFCTKHNTTRSDYIHIIVLFDILTRIVDSKMQQLSFFVSNIHQIPGIK